MVAWVAVLPAAGVHLIVVAVASIHLSAGRLIDDQLVDSAMLALLFNVLVPGEHCRLDVQQFVVQLTCDAIWVIPVVLFTARGVNVDGVAPLLFDILVVVFLCYTE